MEEKKKEPHITLFIDAHFLIKEKAEIWKSIMKDKYSPSEFLSRHIGNSYYNCMSGGFPIYELLICRALFTR